MQLGQPACWTPRRNVSIRTAPGKEKSGITRFARPYGHLFRFPLALRFADRGRAVWGLAEPTPESSGAGNTERRVKTNAPIKFHEVPENYLPRTNFRIMGDHEEYVCRIPRVSWVEPGETILKPLTEYFRCEQRKRISVSMERTLISCIAPPQAMQVKSVNIAFKSLKNLVALAGLTHSTVMDFFVKSTGPAELMSSTLDNFPFIEQHVV